MSHDQKKSKIIQSFIEKFPKGKATEDHLFLEFAQRVLKHVHLDELVQAPWERWFWIIESLWHQAQSKPLLRAQPSILSKTFRFYKREAKRTVIQLINRDKPFLLDSTLAELKRHKWIPTLILHPVLGIERDQEGRMTRFKKEGDGSYKGEYESFIHIELRESLSPEEVTSLTMSLAQVMKNVSEAVEDWPPMRDTLISLFSNPSLLEEEKRFLTWIDENHWTFLGYRFYAVDKREEKYILHLKESLGIFRNELEENRISYGIALHPSFLGKRNARKIRYSKITTESLVHKSDLLDLIEIPLFDRDGECKEVVQFFGLFTSLAYRESPWQIPILRDKVQSVFTKSGLLSDWHDGKKWVRFLDDFPRDELFSLETEKLYNFSVAILEAQEHHESKILLRLDPFHQFLSCIIYLPQENYSSETIEKAFHVCQKELAATPSSCHVRLGDAPYAWIHLIIRCSTQALTEASLKFFEQRMLQSLETWDQSLKNAILKEWGEEKGQYIWPLYEGIFDHNYKKRFTPQETQSHMKVIQSLISRPQGVRFHLEKGEEKNKLKLQIFSLNQSISLSTLLPILENLGIQVKSENLFSFKLNEIETKISIQDMEILLEPEGALEFKVLKDYLLDSLDALWEKEIENDGFNKLILKVGLTYKECLILRAYSKYMRQIQVPFSLEYIQETLFDNPHITKDLIYLFHQRFNPSKNKTSKSLLASLKRSLKETKSTDEDRILGLYLKLMMATVRTNYYQTDSAGKSKTYLSFKIESRKLEEIPLPKPLYEIFVYASFMKAVHLRGGMVARGGIRWSDRKEDFRTEVLGLMKAQMTKNAVIVPAGSKGGFILKNMPETRENAIRAYQTMIRGMLDLTDNIVKGCVVAPPQVRCYDGEDTYLVVAADKGTATFSDIANKISEEYGFWLGDAFASGGSSGYDHKKMAITSRGAWESVKRHFHRLGELGLSKPFQVVGVGDMAGDVFGNGMLLSDQIKLVGAFNHVHIFIDPTPDPLESFQERKRLFQLPTSTWKDYNSQVLSKGGRIFDRSEKTVSLTKEIKQLLGISRDEITPNDLVRHLLLLPVDLLWFGGIGTFVKSCKETHLDVGDKNNDYLRVDGQQLRCRILGEGANLGVTQKGRVEYALKGGLINTDFVDNSAGVDCSDHEVNIKILLNPLVREEKLTLQERNEILLEMQEEVAQLVLKDNYFQNLALQVTEFHSQEDMEDHLSLMGGLEKSGILSRSLEFLPEDGEIRQGRLSGKSGKRFGLTTPELAVLMAYVKNDLKQRMKEKNIFGPLFEKDLYAYFPHQLQKRFQKEIKEHPLKAEIIAMVMTNLLINRLGLTFIYDLERRYPEATLYEIVHSFIVVRDLFNLEDLWKFIDQQDRVFDLPIQIRLLTEVAVSVRQACSDLLMYPSLLEKGLKEEGFKRQFQALMEEGKKWISSEDMRFWVRKKMSSELIEALCLLKVFPHPFQILYLSQQQEHPLSTVIQIYFKIREDFRLSHLTQQAKELIVSNPWQQKILSLQSERLIRWENLWCLGVLKREGFLESSFYKNSVKSFESLLDQLKETPFDLTLFEVALHHLEKLSNSLEMSKEIKTHD